MLAVVVATVVVQGVLVEADCVGVVSEPSSICFVVMVVVLENIGVVVYLEDGFVVSE